MSAVGHDPGHPPEAYTWAALLEALRAPRGGWTALAEELSRRGGGAVELPTDLGSIERGLRRLSRRGQRDGGQYGRWVLRFFAVPEPIGSWLRWMGQYHHRFSDLPVSLRRRQLALWDRPPVSDAAAGAWLDLGMASVGMRLADRSLVDARLARASRRVERAGPAAMIERELLVARLASEDDDGAGVVRALDAARGVLDAQADALGAIDAGCYRARLLDGQAYRALHPAAGDRDAGLDEGERLYRAIPEATGVPFVDLRRALGLAYCRHRRGDREGARALALEAAEHAADGGFVRFRVMAFALAARAADPEEAARLTARATRLSTQLEDEDLLARVGRR